MLIAVLLLLAPLAALAQQPAPASQSPQSALFSEEGVSSQPLSLEWFFLGLYVLAGVIFAGACAHQAVHKALAPVPWFFVGLFLNAVGYLILLTRPPGDAAGFLAGIPRGLRKVPCTFDSVECPGCGHCNHPTADHCEGCGHEMPPPFESEAAHWRKQRPQ